MVPDTTGRVPLAFTPPDGYLPAMSSTLHPAIPADGLAVLAHWDAEAGVWWAESTDLPGLVAEADTIETLIADLRAIIPDLMELNAVPHQPTVRIRLIADRIEAIELAA
jgi:hypothetical protein